ncbi:hypothetical protein [Neosynechococcus sphagnicola]|uniref:hypothetical protein n=1 Tax=Neosynechococcus sphagnicola TaxID=1501145 RepID=UPI00068BFA15|nr:hypothetical protein [Neosynechococcus sphagnicola]
MIRYHQAVTPGLLVELLTETEAILVAGLDNHQGQLLHLHQIQSSGGIRGHLDGVNRQIG